MVAVNFSKRIFETSLFRTCPSQILTQILTLFNGGIKISRREFRRNDYLVKVMKKEIKLKFRAKIKGTEGDPLTRFHPVPCRPRVILEGPFSGVSEPYRPSYSPEVVGGRRGGIHGMSSSHIPTALRDGFVETATASFAKVYGGEALT